MSKVSKCDMCGSVCETFRGKNDVHDKRMCRACQRKLIKEKKRLGRTNPNMVR